jgi:FkbM family methyltransferase
MTSHQASTGPSPTCTWQIECGGAKRVFTLFDTKLGRIACDEVLSGKSYPRLPLAGQVRTIVDVGANVGAATVYFALQFPGAGIYAYEPSPECFVLLTANTHDLPQVRCFNVGLFDRDGQAMLYRGRDDAVASSIGHSREQSAEGQPIELLSADKALTSVGLQAIDILKLDTEGCEVAILRSLAPRFGQIGIVYVEFHSERDRLEIDRLLTPTHALYQGAITRPYRGELCYVARQILPASIEKDAAICVE